MRQSIFTYIILLIGFMPVTLQAAVDSVAVPRILIINSYSVEQDDAGRVTRLIEKELLKKYPRANIHSGNLNIDRAVTIGVPQYALRSLLWSFVEDVSDESIAESQSPLSIFSSPTIPDVIVFIGLDGLIFYQSHGYMLHEWKNIPLIVCSQSDSIITGDWSPQYDYSNFIPLEARRNTSQFVLAESYSALGDKTLQNTPHIVDNKSGYMLTQNYNLTGVKSTLPVRENLKLIHTLMPDLKEIVWIDNDYYASGYARFLVEKEMKDIMPGVRLATTKHNTINSDSIFNEMLQAVPDRAFLTYAWSIHGIYSKHSEKFLRELFTEQSTVPFFSLTKPLFENNYRLGGDYRPTNDFVDKTVNQVSRILNGEPANSIPFETVAGSTVMLNQLLLRKYGLEKTALTEVNNLELTNMLPTFFELHEKKIFGGSILLIFIAGLIFFFRMWKRQNRDLKRESDRYRVLSDMLGIIYDYASADFGLYDASGKLISYNLNGNGTKNEVEKILSGNLFENPFLKQIQKEAIKKHEQVDTEIITETEDKFSASFIDMNIYQLTVLPLQETYKYASYLMLIIDHTQVMRERTEKQRFEALINFASEFSQTGIAYHNLETGEINATSSWYTNLNEPDQSTHIPQYNNVWPEDRSSLLEFRERALKGNRESLISDIRIINDKVHKHWIREYLFSNQWDNNTVVELNINIDQMKDEEFRLYEIKKKAEEANQETKTFLSNINHEIRTPLNSIVGFSAFLAASDDCEENKEYIKIIHRANILLSNLIEDIIDLSKIDSGEVVFQKDPVNLNITFADWTKYCKTILYDKKLDIICDIPDEEISIRTDYFYFSRLMINLLNNAIKFTETGSVVFGFRVETDHYFFYVKDTGCGIDNMHQQLIFKHFTKINTFAQGTGLGLALCKRIVEKLGGEIGVNSRLGKGSTFWFTLPKFAEIT